MKLPARFSGLCLLACLLAAGCLPQITEIVYRPYHDPFDTIPEPIYSPLPEPLRAELTKIVQRASYQSAPPLGTYTQDLVPIGTIYMTVEGARRPKCDCNRKEIVCGENQFSIQSADLPGYTRLLRRMDSAVKVGAVPAPRGESASPGLP